MENKIPTAEEYMSSKGWAEPKYILVGGKDVEKVMIEFAKLHVQAALEAASKNIKLDYSHLEAISGMVLVDKTSILNAYPLENIK